MTTYILFKKKIDRTIIRKIIRSFRRPIAFRIEFLLLFINFYSYTLYNPFNANLDFKIIKYTENKEKKKKREEALKAAHIHEK